MNPAVRPARSASLGRAFGLLSFGILAGALAILAVVFFVVIGRYTDAISRDYAILYSNELVGDLEAQLGREITLSVQAAADPAIQDWLLDETAPERQTAARRSFAAIINLFQGRDFFVAAARSRNFRFLPQGTTPDLVPVTGQLDPANPDDLWFFKSLELPGDYHLNVDTDRFVSTTRIWINSPVRRNGLVIGVLGTGMYLEPLVESIIRDHSRRGARSIVINGHAAIQLDQDIANILENSYQASNQPAGTIYRYHDSPAFRSELEAYLRNPDRPIALRLDGGAYQYAAISPIAGTAWHAVTFFGLGQLYDPQDMIRLTLVLTAILVAALLTLTVAIRRLFLRPFSTLVTSLDGRTPDSREPIAGLERRDEFGILARSVRDLADRLVQSVPVGMFLLDHEGRFKYGNPYFLRQFACGDCQDFGQRFDNEPASLFVTDADYHVLRQFLRDGREQLVLETRLAAFDGTVFWARLHLNRVPKHQGPDEFEGLLINIQHQKDTEHRLINLASTDQLTGLFNRHYLDQTISTTASRCERAGSSLSLFIFDLDHFKRVNDQYGHDAGDEVLIQAAAAAKAALRESDSLIRWGGEEFAVILPDTGLEGAVRVAEKLRKLISARPHPSAGTITASFGVAERQSGESWQDWFKRADDALFRAKAEGRDRVCTAPESLPPGLVQPAVQLVWQDAYNSGNRQIDLDHRTLFNLANQSISLAVTGAPADRLLGLLATLSAELERHMADEEAIISRLGFPEPAIAEHAREHRRLLSLGTILLETIARKPQNAVSPILDFVNEVVLQHMMNEDQKYYPLTRAGGSPP